jgi:hypothetical protein
MARISDSCDVWSVSWQVLGDFACFDAHQGNWLAALLGCVAGKCGRPGSRERCRPLQLLSEELRAVVTDTDATDQLLGMGMTLVLKTERLAACLDGPDPTAPSVSLD